MNAPLYTIEVLRLAASLPDPVPLDRSDGSADGRSPTCGSTVATSVRIDSDGRLEALSQAVSACAFGQASAALVARHAAGRTRDDVQRVVDSLAEWLAGSTSDVPEWPELDALAPARSRRSRHGAVLLPFKTLAAAMKDARA